MGEVAPCIEPTRHTPAFAGELGQVHSLPVMVAEPMSTPACEPVLLAVLFRGGSLVCALGQGRTAVGPRRMETAKVTRET